MEDRVLYTRRCSLLSPVWLPHWQRPRLFVFRLEGTQLLIGPQPSSSQGGDWRPQAWSRPLRSLQGEVTLSYSVFPPRNKETQQRKGKGTATKSSNKKSPRTARVSFANTTLSPPLYSRSLPGSLQMPRSPSRSTWAAHLAWALMPGGGAAAAGLTGESASAPSWRGDTQAVRGERPGAGSASRKV